MDASHVNSFIRGAVETIYNISNQEPGTGKPYSKKNLEAGNSVIGVVGFNGDMEGQVIYSFNPDYAKQLLSSMFFMEIEKFDDMALSALGELCNMISGRSATYFGELADKKINITPPAVMTGENMQVSVKPPVLCIPFVEDNNGAILEVNYTLN